MPEPQKDPAAGSGGSGPLAGTAAPLAGASTLEAAVAYPETGSASGSNQTAAEPPAAPAPPASPLSRNGILVRVGQADASPVDLQVKQVSGAVQVAVRTADPALQSSLRQELPALVRSLERVGFRAETFTPADSTQAAASSRMSAGEGHADAHGGSSNPGDPGADSHFSGGSSGEADRQSGQPDQQPRQRLEQQWLEQMEE